MTTNLLTPDQADFETSTTGWAAVQDTTTPVSPVPLNMLSEEQATFESNSTVSTATGRFACWITAGTTFQTMALAPGEGIGGTQAVRVTSNFAGSTWLSMSPAFGGGASAPAMRYPVTAGQTVTAMWHFRADGMPATGFFTVDLGMAWFDAAGAAAGSATSVRITMTTDWQMARITTIVPAGVAFFTPSWASPYANGYSFYVDRAGVFMGDVDQWVAPSAGWAKNLLVPDSPTPTAELAGMETNVNTTGQFRASGWNVWGGNQLSEWSSDRAAEGTHSVKATQTVSLTNAQIAPRSSGNTSWVIPVPVVPGKGYTYLASMYTPTQDTQGYVQMLFQDSAGTAIGTTLNPGYFGPPNVWRNMVCQGTAPANAARIANMIIGAAWPAGLAGQVVYIDKAGFFEGFIGAWSSPDLVNAARTAGGSHGSWSMALTRLGPSGPIFAQTTTINNVTVGRTYTGMCWFKAQVARVGRVYLDAIDSGGNVLGSSLGTVNLVPGVWTKGIVTAVAPAGAARVVLRVGAMGVNQGEVLLVDQAGLMDGETSSWAPGGQVVPPSILALPDPNRHRLAIQIMDLTSSAPIKLNRILPGGRIEPVRHAQALVPTGSIALTDDYDVPTDTPFRYQAIQNGNVIATSDFITLPSGNTFWLGEVNSGQFIQIIPAANAIPQWSREAPVGVHRVLGRQDPVVVSDVRWWAEGELTHYTLSMNQRDEVGNIWSFGTTLGFYGPVDIIGGIGRLYILSNQVDERRVSARGYEDAREWHAQITQVAEPTGAARIPVIVTWQDVVNGYATWQDVVDGEDDWLDVMQGVPGQEDVLPPVGWDW